MEFQDLFFQAQVAKFTGDVEAQVEALNAVIKRDKNSHAAYHELSKAYLSNANYEMAEKHALKATQLGTQNEWYHLNLAEIYEQRNKPTKAIDSYRKLQNISPQNPVIYHRLALLQLQIGQDNEAAATLEALQKKDGIDEETSRRIFDIYRNSGQEKKAISTLQQLIAANAGNARLMGNLASYYMETNRTEEALSLYEDILKVDPNHPAATIALSKETKPQDKGEAAYLSQLLPLMTNMNLPLDDKIKELMPHISTMKKEGAATDELDKISQKLVDLYDKDAKVYALRGDVLYYKGDFSGAETHFEKAIKIDDRNFSLWHQYMQTLWELEKIDALTDISEEAVDLYPNKATAMLFHALALKQGGDGSGATSLLKEAQMVAGNNKSLAERVELVQLWLEKGTVTESDLSGLAIDSYSESIYQELAGDLYAALDKKKAEKLWRRALELGANPDRLNKRLGLQ